MSAFEYTVRRSARARRARVQVGAEGVEVVLPRRMALRHAAPLVEEKRAWIERTLVNLRLAEHAVPSARLVDGGRVPLLGEAVALRVRVEPGRTRPHVALARDGGLSVAVGEPGEEAIRDALKRWYRRRARVELAARLDAACARAGSRYTKLSIRGQRTRWASCSSTGAMSFNWRLPLAPREVVDYVVEHEVAHLEVHDHSRRFWSLLQSRCPDYRQHEAWLRRHGQGLRL